MKKFLGILLFPVLLNAASENGVTLPDNFKISGKTLVLNGMGTRLASVILGIKVKVYVAGLYLEKKSQKADEIISSDSPKKLVMEFVREVPKEKMVKNWEEGYQKNCKDKCSTHQTHLQKYLSLMQDMKEKDKIALTFYPDRLAFQINSEEPTVISNADFAEIILSIFIGPNPPNEELRDGLLGINK